MAEKKSSTSRSGKKASFTTKRARSGSVGTKRSAAGRTEASGPKKKTTVRKDDAERITISTKRRKKKQDPVSVPTEKAHTKAQRAAALFKRTEKSDTKSTKETRLQKQRTPLSLLIPFSIPADQQQLMVQLSRICGVVFVVLGAAFTLLNLNALDGVRYASSSLAPSQPAQVVGTAVDTVADPLLGDPEPAVSFALEGDPPLSGVVTYSFTVKHAESVTAMAYYKDGQELIDIGAAEQVSSDTWQITWDTTTVPDGKYRMKVVVENDAGSYDASNDTYEVVDNTTGADADPASDTEPEAEIKVAGGERPISGDVRISVRVAQARDVEIFAFNTDKDKNYELGYATQESDDEWVVQWSTTDFPNGEYRVKARIANSHGEYVSGPVYTDVDNLDDSLVNTAADTVSAVGDVAATATDATTKAASDTADTAAGATTDTTKKAASDTTDTVKKTANTDTLQPGVRVSIPEESPVSGGTDVLIEVPDAEFVEVYARSTKSLTKTFLGLAKQRDPSRWRFDWDTTMTPNGRYTVIVQVKNAYGLYSREGVTVSVDNPPARTHSPEQSKKIDALSTAADEAAKLSETTSGVVEDHSSTGTRTVAEEAGTSTATSSRTREALATEDVLTQYSEEIDAAMQELARALRDDDSQALTRAEQTLEALTREIHAAVDEKEFDAALSSRIKERVSDHIGEREATTRQRETIIRDRVGDEVFTDSDGDDISDYDEVNIYNTDPFSADSDNDGFTDGAEVLGGFDPTDDTPEVPVQYESPKESGIVRDDILSVDTITGITPDPADEVSDGVPTQAVITGTGLPNSFVTLYIFSTPVVVTVKTDEEGSWSYTFDKELEDGRHEVYVGITDNAGRIVAKSNPLPFVKTAEAFSPVDARASDQATPSDGAPTQSFFSENIVMLVLAISVVAIGLVLMLLGMHLRVRQSEEEQESMRQSSDEDEMTTPVS